MKNRIIISIFLFLICAKINKAFINNFHKDVYKELLASTQERFVVSPLLANVALSMVSLGAQNKTAEEMRTALDLSSSVYEVKATFKDFFKVFKNYNMELTVANIIYVSNNFTVSDKFSQAVKDVFRGQTKRAYFGKSWAASNMNEWIEKQMRAMIPKFFPGTFDNPSSFLSVNTRALIVNAIYLEASWRFPFSKHIKSNGKFYINSSYTVDIENLINLPSGDKFNYCIDENLDAQILELPFKADNASMIFILPRNKTSLIKLEDQMDKVLQDHPFESTDIRIELPTFFIETPLIDYKNLFKDSKLGNIFEPGKADLSGIAGEPNELYFNSLLQKIVFDLNSNGVGRGSVETIFNYTEEPYKFNYKHEFIADHPFLFYVKVQHLILFVGKYMGPTERETLLHREYKRIVRPKEKQLFIKLL